MAGEAIRSLHAAIGFKIDQLPLQKLDKLLDEIKNSMLGSAVSKFEEDMDEASKSAKELGGSVKKAADETEQLGDEADRASTRVRTLGSSLRQMGNGLGSAYNRLREYTNGFERLRNTANNTFSSINQGLLRMAGATIRAPFTLPGMLAGGALGYAAYRSVASPIIGAAELELQSIQLEALLQDADKAKRLFEDMNRLGAVSSFSERDFLEGAKAFIPLTKDIEQINQLVRLQERLAASNPNEGMTGAAFSIREALSGDTVSLAERFNVPKNMLDNLKKATDMTGRIRELDKILTNMGFTQEYLNKVNKAAATQWDNLGSNIRMNFARRAGAALEELKPFLTDINIFLQSERAERMFTRWGEGLAKLSREARSFGNWLIDEGGRAFDYIDRRYLSNPEFQQLPFNKKINVVFDDITNRINSWYDGKGRAAIESGAQRFVDFTVSVVSNNLPTITGIGIDVGKSLAKGMLDGLQGHIQANPLLSVLFGAGIGATVGSRLGPWGAVGGAAIGGITVLGVGSGVLTGNYDRYNKPVDSMFIQAPQTGTPLQTNSLNESLKISRELTKRQLGQIDGSHENGLPFVPKDDYIARLHKGERVLTAEANKRYTRMMTSGGGSATFSPVVNQNITVTGGEPGRVQREVQTGTLDALEDMWRSLARRNEAVTEY